MYRSDSRVPYSLQKMKPRELQEYASSFIPQTEETRNRRELHKRAERIIDSLTPHIPSRPNSNRDDMSLNAYQTALDNRRSNNSRTISALHDESIRTNGRINRGFVNKQLKILSNTPKGKHAEHRIQHLTTVVEEKKGNEENLLKREQQQTAANTIRRSRAVEAFIKQRKDVDDDRWGGGYAKLTKMGLLARIMNIKKKAVKRKVKPAKPTKPTKRPTKPIARKAAKPKPAAKPTKPTKPVVRRRKPTGVRK
jgi:hypothetical protein